MAIYFRLCGPQERSVGWSRFSAMCIDFRCYQRAVNRDHSFFGCLVSKRSFEPSFRPYVLTLESNGHSATYKGRISPGRRRVVHPRVLVFHLLGCKNGARFSRLRSRQSRCTYATLQTRICLRHDETVSYEITRAASLQSRIVPQTDSTAGFHGYIQRRLTCPNLQ